MLGCTFNARANADVKERYAKLGAESMLMSSEAFNAFLKTETGSGLLLAMAVGGVNDVTVAGRKVRA